MLSAHFDAAELIGQCYEAAFDPARWGEALDDIAHAFNARGAILPAATFSPGVLPHSAGMRDVLAQFFEEGWHERDARTFAAQKVIGSSDIVADQDLFSEEDIAGSSYYHGFARSAGVPWFCAATLSMQSPQDYVALSLQRTAGQGMFESAEIAALRHLLPHLRNAAGFAERLAQRQGQATVEALDLAGTPALVVDKAGRILAANARFSALRHPALAVRGGRLLCPNPAGQKALDGLMAGTGQPSGPLILRATGEALPLLVRAAPLPRADAAPFHTQASLLVLSDPTSHIALREESLRALFGLTRREAQLMALLGDGHDLTAIAALMGIGREAVRFHLKSLFAKTDTRRQSALVALCRTLGAALS